MHALALTLLIAVSGPVPDGAVLQAHKRRGALIERTGGAAAESWRACAAACGLRDACQAWTFRETEAACDLHSAPATPRRHPGAVTGLSPALAAAIEAASERPPNARERAALEALEHGLSGPGSARVLQSPVGSQGLAGGPPQP